MNAGKTVLAQLLEGVHPEQFRRCAARYPMPRNTPALSAYDHFVAMVFAQLTYRESLRDIEACLRSRRSLLYHSGIRGVVKRCNLAYANERRDARLFAGVAMALMRRASRLYSDQAEPLGLDGELFAIDASLIDLSLALFPWARWQGSQAAVKLNVVLAVAAELPVFCSITEGDRHEMSFLDQVPLSEGAYYVMDRGYVDFARLHRIHLAQAWFVIRAKCNLRHYVSESRPVDKASGLRCDQSIRLNLSSSRRAYPELLRRVRFRDALTGKSLVLLTNNFNFASADHRRGLPPTLGNRAVLPLDQTAPAPARLFLHQPQRRRRAGLVGHLRLPARRHRQEGVGSSRYFASNSATCLNIRP